MIIECGGCFKKFNVDESRLRPDGSKLKCTKCGNIFQVFPPAAGSVTSPLGKDAKINPAAVESRNRTPAVEKRQHPRIGISVPVSCSPEDPRGKPLGVYKGHVTEVSQTGVTVELFGNSIADLVSMSFTNHEGEKVRVKGRVLHSVQMEPGKCRLGVSLLGLSQSINRFVANLVRAHHLTRNLKQN